MGALRGDVTAGIADLSEEDLRKELDRRMRKANPGHSANNCRIPAGEARVALDDAAAFLRRLGKQALAFKMDEIAEDWVGVEEKMRIKSKAPVVILPGTQKHTSD